MKSNGTKDSIGKINEVVSRLRGLHEMKVSAATTRVEIAKADLQPTVLEAQVYLEMLEAAEEKYRDMLENLKERNLTQTYGNRWAMVVDDAVQELSVMLHVLSRQLHQAIELAENFSAEDIVANVHHRIRTMVKGADGAESRIDALIGQIKQGLELLNKMNPPENGTKIKVDPSGKQGLPRLHDAKPNLKVIT